MSIADKAKELAAELAARAAAALPNKDEDADEICCGTDDTFVDPDDFSDFSDFDSLMVDSKEGAPE